MIEIVGRIDSVRFHDPSNHFIIAQVIEENTNAIYKVVGNIFEYNEYDLYRFILEEGYHKIYGRQYTINSVSKVLTTQKDMIIKYLSCPLFKGVGEKLATTIVDTLGDDCLAQIIKEPDILDTVPRLSAAKKETIVNVLCLNNHQQDIEFLFTHGLGMANISKIIAFYKDDIIDKLSTNPYQLVEDIDGIGFSTADKFALRIGVQEDHPLRIKAAINNIIKDLCFKAGNTYLEQPEIWTGFRKMLGLVDYEMFSDILMDLCNEGIIILENDRYFPKDLYKAELSIANNLKKYQTSNLAYNLSNEKFNNFIDLLQEKKGIGYDDTQKEAIYSATINPFTIITGGPGTGKTTIVETILAMIQEFYPDKQVVLTAPTGRASKRMKDLTSYESSTIHRLLKWDGYKNVFEFNSYNPVSGDILVVDEFSMVDTSLFSSLLKATINFEKVILIGDVNQLPSVSPGNVLKDLIDSEVFNTVILKRVFRQKNKSGITELAHAILNNEFDFAMFKHFSDIDFIECDKQDINNMILSLLEEQDLDTLQVLAPVYAGVNGVDALNGTIQSVVNAHKRFKTELKLNQTIYREGDKVLQLKNRTDDDVYNGDIGKITLIERKEDGFPSDIIYIDFDGREISYSNGDFDNITLAYAMTVHKSQGCEFNTIIMPFDTSYGISLRKKLVYTAITRAKHQLVLLGSQEAFIKAINNDFETQRKTTLLERLRHKKELTPYDFL